MATKSLGTLTLDLVARIGGFEKGMDQAARTSEKRLKEIQQTASKIGVGIGLALAGAATGLGVLVKGAIDSADEIGKLSQKIGIGTEDLSKLAYAAKLADVDTAALQVGLQKLSKSAVDASSGTGDAAAAFKALGVSVVDANGKIKDTNTLTLELADAFSKFADGPEKTAAAMALLGKSGADLIPLFNGGAEAIKAAGVELEKFGGVITPEAAANAETFNDNLTKLQVSSSGFANQLGSQLSPVLAEITNRLVELTKDSDATKKAAEGVEVVFRGLTGTAAVVGNVFQILGDNVAATAAALAAVAHGDFAGAMEVLRARTEDFKTDINDILTAFDKAPAVLSAPFDASAKSADEATKKVLGFSAAIKEAKDSAKKLEEDDPIGDLTDKFVDRGTSIFGEDALAGLDFSPLNDQLQLAAENFDYFKNKVVEFDDTFKGAFEAYAASVSNVGALLGGDLVTALDSAIARTADLAANTILWGEGGTEALKALGRSIITDVVSGLIRAGLQMAVNFALQRTLSAASTAAGATEAAALATAWSPAAIAASIATLGSADAVGLAAYTAAQASGQAVTQLSGFADGGFTGHGPLNQVAGVVHKGEYVLSNDMLKSLDEMASSGGSNGSVEVNNYGEPMDIRVRRTSRKLFIEMMPLMLDSVDEDQERRTSTGLGRNFRATASKLGAQPSSGR